MRKGNVLERVVRSEICIYAHYGRKQNMASRKVYAMAEDRTGTKEKCIDYEETEIGWREKEKGLE